MIHNPHALPLFREVRGSKRHLDGRAKDAADRMKPDVGATSVTGTGTGGQIGVTGGTLLTQYVLKNQVRCLLGWLSSFCSLAGYHSTSLMGRIARFRSTAWKVGTQQQG